VPVVAVCGHAARVVTAGGHDAGDADRQRCSYVSSGHRTLPHRASPRGRVVLTRVLCAPSAVVCPSCHGVYVINEGVRWLLSLG